MENILFRQGASAPCNDTAQEKLFRFKNGINGLKPIVYRIVNLREFATTDAIAPVYAESLED